MYTYTDVYVSLDRDVNKIKEEIEKNGWKHINRDTDGEFEITILTCIYCHILHIFENVVYYDNPVVNMNS